MAQTGRDSDLLHSRLDDLLDRHFAVKAPSESSQLIEANPELLSVAADERITARFRDLSPDDEYYFFHTAPAVSEPLPRRRPRCGLRGSDGEAASPGHLRSLERPHGTGG